MSETELENIMQRCHRLIENERQLAYFGNVLAIMLIFKCAILINTNFKLTLILGISAIILALIDIFIIDNGAINWAKRYLKKYSNSQIISQKIYQRAKSKYPDYEIFGSKKYIVNNLKTLNQSFQKSKEKLKK